MKVSGSPLVQTTRWMFPPIGYNHTSCIDNRYDRWSDDSGYFRGYRGGLCAGAVAVLVMVPTLFGLTISVIVAESSGARVPRLQVTRPTVWPQPVDASIKFTSAGRVSVNMTFVAGSGP